jgi:hydroxymethylpyrimidine/phosphomethylpyrimidine kinase
MMVDFEGVSLKIYPGATALTIGGSDPSGGAGIQADLKTFQQLGVFGTSAITLLTVQNTQGLREVSGLDSDLVVAQVNAVLDDIEIRAAKTGALGNVEIIEAVAERAASFDFPLVVDPVMISKHGHPLIDEEAVDMIRKKLLSSAYLVTPNRFEAEELVGFELKDEDAVAKAVHDLHAMGAKHVLLKLGEQDGNSVHIFGDGSQNTSISVPRLESNNLHGTGCVLSAAITARLARGEQLIEAVHAAIGDVWQAIHSGQAIGRGIHPVEFCAIGIR